METRGIEKFSFLRCGKTGNAACFCCWVGSSRVGGSRSERSIGLSGGGNCNRPYGSRRSQAKCVRTNTPRHNHEMGIPGTDKRSGSRFPVRKPPLMTWKFRT